MPYRESEQALRYICIVCYSNASSVEGTCGNCGGAPLQQIEGNDEIVAELRRRAREKKERVGGRQFAFVGISSLLLAVLIHGVLIGFHVYDVNPHGGGWGRHSAGGIVGVYVLLTFLGLFMLLSYAVDKIGVFKASETEQGFNPETADLAALLEWLGIDPAKKKE